MFKYRAKFTVIMKIIADLHIHSRHSRATSKDISVENLEKYARIKGLNLLGTGDFTHPKWLAELKANLAEDDSGILKTKTGFPFVLQGEISLAYTQDGKGRRIHFVLLAPSFAVVEQITEALLKKGRVDYDGRPIFGFSSIELVEMMRSIDDKIEIIPAHAWTPWFGIFGSKSGFDSIKQCFKEKTKHIYAIETGLSSDPPMNWRLSALDKITLLSNSDLHSYWPWRIGREANIFDIELNYNSLQRAIRTREGMLGTIEVDPGYGKYHFDGHKACGISFSPEQTKKLNSICPKCKRPLTIGVLNRVEELADRPEGFKLKGAPSFVSVIPLSELISHVYGITLTKTWTVYNELIARFGNEFQVLLDAPYEELKKITDEKLADFIIKNREGKIQVTPGYDGEYGVPVFDGNTAPKPMKEFKPAQKGLDEFL
jgi:uncharacterized protein (TIGR00375 family)